LDWVLRTLWRQVVFDERTDSSFLTLAWCAQSWLLPDLLWLKRHQSSDNALGFSSQDILMDLIHVWCSVLSLDLVWPRILSTSRNSMTKNDRNADFGVQDSRFHSFCLDFHIASSNKSSIHLDDF